ncbi:MAG: hypothetical protein AAFY71_19810 [Bacteroidota bacterium]
MSNPLSNWNHFVSDMQYSPQEFFEAVKNHLEKLDLPEVHTSFITFRQPKIGKRLYLRVEHLKNTIDIGAAPYGNGFFISYWVNKDNSSSIIARIYRGLAELFVRIPVPIVPQILYNILTRWADTAEKAKLSYYAFDDVYMFQQAVHRSIMTVINDASSMQGRRQMQEFVPSPTSLLNA